MWSFLVTPYEEVLSPGAELVPELPDRGPPAEEGTIIGAAEHAFGMPTPWPLRIYEVDYPPRPALRLRVVRELSPESFFGPRLGELERYFESLRAAPWLAPPERGRALGQLVQEKVAAHYKGLTRYGKPRPLKPVFIRTWQDLHNNLPRQTSRTRSAVVSERKVIRGGPRVPAGSIAAALAGRSVIDAFTPPAFDLAVNDFAAGFIPASRDPSIVRLTMHFASYVRERFLSAAPLMVRAVNKAYERLMQGAEEEVSGDVNSMVNDVMEFAPLPFMTAVPQDQSEFLIHWRIVLNRLIRVMMEATYTAGRAASALVYHPDGFEDPWTPLGELMTHGILPWGEMTAEQFGVLIPSEA